MLRTAAIVGFCLCGMFPVAVGLQFAQTPDGRPQSAGPGAASLSAERQSTADADDPVAHGRYLVQHVALCIYCHSPRDENGTPNPQQLLTGASIPVESPFLNQRWAAHSPKIAGLPGGWTSEQVATFLQSGATPDGRQARLPMPPFRMNARDALGVAAYLQSLE